MEDFYFRRNARKRIKRRKETMSTATIYIEVDADAARVLLQAPDEEKRRLQLLLSLRLREVTGKSTKPLLEIMGDIGVYAESQGMTPELLEAMLRDR